MNNQKQKKPRDWKLIDTIIKSSQSDTWQDAKNEWVVKDYWYEDDATCICGHEHINHCHTLENKETGESVGPIGSSCIEKFESQTMKDDVSLTRTMVELNKEFDQYTRFNNVRPLLRNRKLMNHLIESSIFQNENEESFYMKMVRKTTPMTEKQESWMRRLVFYNVKPYIQRQIAEYHQSVYNPKLKHQPTDIKQAVLALDIEFQAPTTTLKQVYPHLQNKVLQQYLISSLVFENDKTQSFFSQMMDSEKPITEKQISWLRNIIGKQIRPFIREQVNDYQKELTISEDDLSMIEDLDIKKDL